ncbi:MAG: hypothetical protein ACLGH3_10170 [Actinomycetota bacterium]
MRSWIRSLVAVAAIVAMPSGASAVATPAIVSAPGNTFTPVFTTPVAAAQPGEDIMYIQADPTGLHDVVSLASGPDDADHCFKRNIAVPPLGTPFDPSSATFKLDSEGNKISAYQPGQCPLFATALISVGHQYPLEGLQNIEGGQIYEFKCSIHSNMRGRLVGIPA